MGLRHSKKIKVVNLLKYAEFPHLDVRGEISVRKDVHFNIPDIELKFDRYFPVLLRLWPHDRISPQNLPVVSSIDSGIDTID